VSFVKTGAVRFPLFLTEEVHRLNHSEDLYNSGLGEHDFSKKKNNNNNNK